MNLYEQQPNFENNKAKTNKDFFMDIISRIYIIRHF